MNEIDKEHNNILVSLNKIRTEYYNKQSAESVKINQMLIQQNEIINAIKDLQDNYVFLLREFSDLLTISYSCVICGEVSNVENIEKFNPDFHICDIHR